MCGETTPTGSLIALRLAFKKIELFLSLILHGNTGSIMLKFMVQSTNLVPLFV